MVVCCTSSPEPIFSRNNSNILRYGCILLDVAYPPDVDERILEDRPDLVLIRCGLIRLPGNIESRIDVHFGFQDDQPLFPACLAQTILLGISKEYEHASLGARVRAESVHHFIELGIREGFAVVVSLWSEPEIYAGKVTV